jgi:N6-L-threonylcarbamoyladenine synthase
MAKAVSSFLKVPIIGINHLKGHIYSAFIEKKEITPMLALLVSGGHTQVIKVESFDNMQILATTIDDSVGEAYDKVAKMLNLGYPGGPIIEQMAKEGDENRFAFPVPLQNSKLIAFSLSGLKNAVRLQIEKLGEGITKQDKCDISASFQKAVLAHILQKSKKIFKSEPTKDFVIVGGVSANSYINNGFKELCKEFNKNIHKVELKYTSDNAVMIGRVAIEFYKNKKFGTIESINVSASKKPNVGDTLE